MTVVGVVKRQSLHSENIEMKDVQGIWRSSYENLKTVKVRDEKKLTSIPNKKYLQSALNKLEMGDRNGVSRRSWMKQS